MSNTYYSDLLLRHGGLDIQASRLIRLWDRDYYCLQYNHAGTISVQIDEQPARMIQGPSLLITSPGHQFEFGSPSGWHHNFIAFSGPRVERYVATGLLPVDQPLRHIEESQSFYALFGSCVKAIKRNAQDEAAHALEGLFLQLHQEPRRKEEPFHHQQVRALADAMREDPLAEYDLEQEARLIHISLAHLRRLFRQLVGHSAGKYLQQCRLSAAADRLASTRDPIKCIAEECHLGGVHYFTRIFRNAYGHPPARFRSELMGEE